MKLSIVIPAYNCSNFISLCLDSLLSQGIEHEAYEVLVINDGSTDHTLTIANSYSKKYKQIKVYDKVNEGVGSARNMGLNLAKGAYVYFIDPDDYLAKDVLATILQQAEHNNLEILTFNSQPITDSSLLHASPNKLDLELSAILTGERYIAENNYNNEVWWYIIKRDFILQTKIKFIEDRWMEDAILTAQLFLKAKRIAHYPINAHRHLIVEGSAMTSKEPSHYLRVINDNYNAALVFNSIIKELINQPYANANCIARLKSRQQSFVFFMMVRMLKSTITLKAIQPKLNTLKAVNAYPLTAFLGKDYKGISYATLVLLFNNKRIYYLLFRVFNPLFKKLYFNKE